MRQIPCKICGYHRREPGKHWCKFCRREYYRKWHSKNRLKRQQYQKDYRRRKFRQQMEASALLAREEEAVNIINPDTNKDTSNENS